MHSTTQKGQWSFLQIYIITRRDEFSISGAFLYTIIYIIRASRYYTLLLSLLFSRYRIPPNQHSLAVSHKYTYTLTRRYFTSHHTYSGKKIPIHHYNIHYTYVYILYKISMYVCIRLYIGMHVQLSIYYNMRRPVHAVIQTLSRLY